MWIYVVNIALIMMWWFYYTLVHSIPRKALHSQAANIDPERQGIGKNILLFVPFLQLYLMLSLKNITVGTDTYQYSLGFREIIHTAWMDIFNLKIEHVVFHFERGFIFLSKCITLLTEDFTVYLALLYALMVFPVYRFIKKHSVMPYLSIILFIAFGFLNFYFSAIRQGIAISLVLLSFDYILKRQPWRFIALIAIATLFHKSAIFFLPAYFLMSLTITPIVGLFYFMTLLMLYIFRFSILRFLTQYIFSDQFIRDTGAYTLLLMVLMTFIVGLFSYKKVTAMNGKNKLIYNLIAVAVGLMVFNTANDIGIRLANYYYVFMILFIPNIIISFKEKFVRHIAVTVVVGFTLIYYFQVGVNVLNVTPYKFYWQ